MKSENYNLAVKTQITVHFVYIYRYLLYNTIRCKYTFFKSSYVTYKMLLSFFLSQNSKTWSLQDEYGTVKL